MIEGVEVIKLTTHTDERGFFREVIRLNDIDKFGQWSHSSMYTGTIKAFHYHSRQTDWWYVPVGVIKAVLVDCRRANMEIVTGGMVLPIAPIKPSPVENPHEYLLGEGQPAQVLKIPPGVAHGLKVLQGPAHLMYITSHVYNPDDEGRIPYDSLGYDWFKQEIK